MAATQVELDKSKAALAKIKLDEATIEKRLADQVLQKSNTDKLLGQLQNKTLLLNATLARTQAELKNATQAARKEKKFQEEVKAKLENEIKVLKKSNEESQKKLNSELAKIKDDYKKKIDLVKKTAEDDADKVVKSAALRRK